MEVLLTGGSQGPEIKEIAPVVKRKMIRAITSGNTLLMEGILKRYTGSNGPITDDASGNSLVALAAI